MSFQYQTYANEMNPAQLRFELDQAVKMEERFTHTRDQRNAAQCRKEVYVLRQALTSISQTGR